MSPCDPIRAICTDDNLRAQWFLIGLNSHSVCIGNDIPHCNPLPDLEPSAFRLLRQPVIEVSASDHAQRMSFWNADGQAFGFKIKVDIIRKDVRDFIEIQIEALEEDLRVEGQAAGAKLGAGIMFLFEEQDTGRELRGKLLKM